VSGIGLLTRAFLVAKELSFDEFWDHRGYRELQVPFLAEHIGMHRHVLALHRQFTGNGPIFITLLICGPIGNVISLALLFAYQFTSMFGEVPIPHPSPGKYWKKYWIFIWLVVCGPGPPTENHC